LPSNTHCLPAWPHTSHPLQGPKPQLQKLNNKASTTLQQHINLQLAPPHLYHLNAADHAIQTFKNHCIAGLCSTSKDFPSTFGTTSYPKLSSLSISSEAPSTLIPNCLPTPNSMMALSSTMEHHLLLLLAPNSLANKNIHPLLVPGPHIPSKAGVLAQHSTTHLDLRNQSQSNANTFTWLLTKAAMQEKACAHKGCSRTLPLQHAHPALIPFLR
jgi:hypothetical protein